VEFLLTWA